VILGAAGRDFHNFYVVYRVVRAHHEFADAGELTLGDVVGRFLASGGPSRIESRAAETAAD
jgi:predicted GTPase